MNENKDYLVFTVDKHRFAIPLNEVAKVMQVVEMKSVPKMPEFLHGIINYYGNVRPVINLHFLFSCPTKEIELSDELIVLNDTGSGFILLVDGIHEVVNFSDDRVSTSDPVMSDKQFIKGVIKLKDGLVLINDVNHFLDPKELKELATALDTKKIQVQL